MSVYVSRGTDGKVNGIFASDQPDMGLEPLSESHPDVIAYRNLPMPITVSARQFRLQLRRSGLLEQVKAWVAQQDGETQDAFEYSGDFVKDSPMMSAGFAEMGFSGSQIDAFFEAASKI
ncbi:MULTISPECIES: hypothetical protein [Rhizobium]|uniref:Uncharacterized protein n=1 Tax=Rhizobium leguminosarum TaxID=384 RepID=A0AAJ1EHT0_RHILE|nr:MULTISPECIES: hypothetical protein [Rhizobium]MBY3036293.1 hypothetical protein [Rhizobium laguerreae]MBY3130631.1 hypothetical protein [Rhizobium laguerreae]MBY5523276.1 hypothetical protein [Rhizobium leguminosarum]MBY5538044.1 hypothetical protein [Rhizobium leguminosarum]MBY5583274.1 hypothetical protein [Rhizobium leguminosarum]